MAPRRARLRLAYYPLAEGAIARLLASRFAPDEQVIALLRDSLGVER